MKEIKTLFPKGEWKTYSLEVKTPIQYIPNIILDEKHPYIGDPYVGDPYIRPSWGDPWIAIDSGSTRKLDFPNTDTVY